MKIFQAISAIMAEVPSIGKNRKNVQQNYTFRGIDDMYNALNDILAKNKVFATSEVLRHEREERQTAKGGVLIYSILTVKFTFYTDDGSSVTSTMIGEGMDSGDKASNKAMSTAYKYALMQIFCIPTDDPKDTELDSHEVVPSRGNTYSQPSADRGLQGKYASVAGDDDKEWLNACDRQGNLTEKGYETAKFLFENPERSIADVRKKYKVSNSDEAAIMDAMAEMKEVIK
jgi:hypothetical protein